MSRIILDYLEDINSSIEEIINFINGLTLEKFLLDRKTVNAVIRSLEVIGEASKIYPMIFVINILQYHGKEWLVCGIN